MDKPRLWSKTFISGTIISFLLVLNYYLLMIIMTQFSAEQFQVSSALAGLAASMFVIGALAARFFSAQLMNRFGAKRLLLLSILTEIIASALYFASFNIIVLYLVRFIHGFSYGAASTTVSTVITSQVPAERRGEGVGYFMLSITLGAAIGPFLGMFLTRNGGYPYIFATCTAVALICMLLALNFKTNRTEQNTAKRTSGNHNFFEASAIPISLVCCGVYFCYSSIISFLTPYTSEIHLENAAAFFFIVYSAAILITRPFTGRMFDSKGPRFTMLPAFISFLVGMILLSRANTGLILLLSAALLGYGVGVIQSSGLALAVANSPEDRVSYANSTFYTFIDTGTGIGPFCLGFMIPALGYRSMYLSMAAVTVLLTIIFLRVTKMKRTSARLNNA